MMYAVVLAMMVSQPPTAKQLPTAKQFPQTPPIEKIAAESSDPYETALAEAVKARKPLVVFVRCESQKAPGAVTVRVNHLPGIGAEPAVVFAVPAPGGHKFYRVLPGGDVASEIALRESEVSRAASPFDKFNQRSAGKTALREARGEGKASWPTSVRLIGMERYEPATATQSIFKYTGNPHGIIRSVPRADTEAKYRVPGGLLGVSGWRSELYRYTPTKPRQWFGMIGVTNSLGSVQYEAAYQRSYDDGCEFDDVLINTDTDRVFEHRIAQKVDGKWERFIAFKDQSERPDGYIPPRSGECATCHSDAAKGKYGVGLPAGSDEIFSEPFVDFPAIGIEKQIPIR